MKNVNAFLTTTKNLLESADDAWGRQMDQNVEKMFFDQY